MFVQLNKIFNVVPGTAFSKILHTILIAHLKETGNMSNIILFTLKHLDMLSISVDYLFHLH